MSQMSLSITLLRYACHITHVLSYTRVLPVDLASYLLHVLIHILFGLVIMFHL